MKDDGIMVRRIGMVGLLAVAGCLLGMSLWAEDEGQSGDPTQSARAVRLSDVEGKVQVLQGNQVLADQAVANTRCMKAPRLRPRTMAGQRFSLKMAA